MAAADAETSFEQTVAALEEAVMDDAFRKRLMTFCESNCHVFPPDGGDELPLEAMSLFHEYTALIEDHIRSHLTAAIQGYDEDAFMAELAQQADAGLCDGEVFDLLLTLGDMEEFVSLMRSHRMEQLASSGEHDAHPATAAAGLAPLVSALGNPTTKPAQASTGSASASSETTAPTTTKDGTESR